MKLKYTVSGDKKFDDKIDKDMKLVTETILATLPGEDIAAIILGGGYGRGEGGVVHSNGKMFLYNDYDMFMVTENISAAKKSEYNSVIFEVSEKLSEKIGIDVDFGPIKNRNELPEMPFTLMYYELKEGHKVTYGDSDILLTLPNYDIKDIPDEELIKLMLNRGVGLLLAGRKLFDPQKKSEDNEFIERNIFKALMAAGDVFLFTENAYNYSYVNRLKSVEAYKNEPLMKDDDFIRYYKMSLDYKLSPSNEFDLMEERYNYTIEVFKKFYLAAFSKYWNKNIADFSEYFKELLDSGISEPVNLKGLLKNCVLNYKKIGFKYFSIKFFLKYPRYRLFFVLPHFLFNEKTIDSKSLRGYLGLGACVDETVLFEKFIKLWNRFN
jgi:hypothetical protein